MQQCDIGFRETKQWAAISISHTFPGDQMVANDVDSNVHNLLTCRKAIPGTAAAACCVGPVVCAAGQKNQWYFFSSFLFFLRPTAVWPLLSIHFSATHIQPIFFNTRLILSSTRTLFKMTLELQGYIVESSR